MKRIKHMVMIPGIWLLGGFQVRAEVPHWIESLTIWLSPSLRTVDRELAEVDRGLLATPAPMVTNSGMSRGFHTGRVREGEDLWVELSLSASVELDRVVLVPMLGKGADGLLPGYGFPRRFQLEAQDEDGETLLLLDETAADFPNPECYPVVADCPAGTKISKIRLTAIEPWDQGGPQVLAMAEVMALKGNRNLALGAETAASSSREMRPTWSRNNLTDMVTPLGLPVLPMEPAPAGWLAEFASRADTTKQVTVDLGKVHRVDQIRMAPVWKPGMPGQFNYGFPSRFAIATSVTSGGEGQLLIHDQREKSMQSPGQNLQCYEVGGEEVRFIRMRATRLRQGAGDFLFALGEVQAYVGGENVALGAEVLVSESVENDQWGKASLTDGIAGGGKLMELPDWIQGLLRHQDFTSRRQALLGRREEFLQQGEQRLVSGSIGLTCSAGLLVGLMLWRGKRQRRLDREMHRERLARDLHDELGSNLGSIALISSFALEGEYEEGQLRSDLHEIEQVARESADSMRDMVELLGGGRGGASSDWLAVMQGMAERLLRNVKLDCRLPESPMLVAPDLETRREIYLFCKEVLHNVAKHSGADEVRICLRPRADGLSLEISDNGSGFDQESVSGGHGLGNLKERASGLGARIDIVSTIQHGTTVTLDIPRGRRWRKVNAARKRQP